MPLKVKIHPVSAEQDPVINVSTSSRYSYRGDHPEAQIKPIVSIRSITSETKLKQKATGAATSSSQNRLVSVKSTSTNSSRVKTTKVVNSSTNTSDGRGVVTSIRYKIVPTVSNCDIPITEEFAPSALENENDHDDEQNTLSKILCAILFFLIAPFWCVQKVINPLAKIVPQSDKYNDNNRRAGGRSIKFFLMLIFLAVISYYFLLADNLGHEEGGHKDSTGGNGHIPLFPEIHKSYVKEARHFKKEFQKLALEATKKVLSHPYEFVRYGVNVEININYNWKQPHCNKKVFIFKNGVCAVKKLKDKSSKRQSCEFDRTNNQTVVENLKCSLSP